MISLYTYLAQAEQGSAAGSVLQSPCSPCPFRGISLQISFLLRLQRGGKATAGDARGAEHLYLEVPSKTAGMQKCGIEGQLGGSQEHVI